MEFKVKAKYVLCAVFLVIIFGVFLVNLFTPDKDFSQNENRVLAAKPEFSADALMSGSYTSDFEEYVNDQFVARDSFIAVKSMSELILGKHENGGVYFLNDRLVETFSKVDEALFSDNISAVRRFADLSDIPVMFMLIPTSQEIYKDKLAYGAPCADEKLLISCAYDEFKGNTVDILGALASCKDEYIFYRTDHHWTSLGAYYGYEALCGALGIEPVKLSDYEKNTLTNDFNGTLYSMSGVRFITPDEIDVYVPSEGVTVVRYDGIEPSYGGLYYEEYLSFKDKYKVFLGGNCGRVVVKTGREDLPKLLLLRDSYADSITPYLTNHFSEIHLLDLRYYKNSITKYAAENNIDEILIMYGLKKFSEDTNIRAFLK